MRGVAAINRSRYGETSNAVLPDLRREDVNWCEWATFGAEGTESSFVESELAGVAAAAWRDPCLSLPVGASPETRKIVYDGAEGIERLRGNNEKNSYSFLGSDRCSGGVVFRLPAARPNRQ
jgi:hypothetical protein